MYLEIGYNYASLWIAHSLQNRDQECFSVSTFINVVFSVKSQHEEFPFLLLFYFTNRMVETNKSAWVIGFKFIVQNVSTR